MAKEVTNFSIELPLFLAVRNFLLDKKKLEKSHYKGQQNGLFKDRDGSSQDLISYEQLELLKALNDDGVTLNDKQKDLVLKLKLKFKENHEPFVSIPVHTENPKLLRVLRSTIEENVLRFLIGASISIPEYYDGYSLVDKALFSSLQSEQFNLAQSQKEK